MSETGSANLEGNVGSPAERRGPKFALKEMRKEILLEPIEGVSAIEQGQVRKAVEKALGFTVPKTEEERQRLVLERPISGGSGGWLMPDRGELQKVNRRLQEIVGPVNEIDEIMLTPDLVRNTYMEIHDLVYRKKKIPESEAQPLLSKLTEKYEKLAGQEKKGGASFSQEALEELRKTREAAEQTASASKKSAEATMGGTRERISQEIKSHPLGDLGWLREKLTAIEGLDKIPFNSQDNRDTITEITSAVPILPEHTKREYLARRALHDYYLMFKTAPNVETARNASADITMENFTALMRIPGVAETITELEKRAAKERGVYREIKAGRRTEAIRPEEKLVTAIGDEVDKIRESIRRDIEPKVANMLRAQGYTDDVIKNITNYYVMSSLRIGERIWHITERSAYWNAFTHAGAPKFSGETHEKWQKGFKAGTGNGELAGSGIFVNVFNLREAVERNVGKGILGYWFDNEEFDPKLQEKIFDPNAGDFWTATIGKYVKDKDLDGEDQRKVADLRLSTVLMRTLSRDDANFLTSLENIPLSEVNYSALGDIQYTLHLSGLNNVDKIRESLIDVNGFLGNPTPDNLAKLAPLFKHLDEDKQDEIKKALLMGMIDLNRSRLRFNGKSLLQTEYGKAAVAWGEAKAKEEVKKLVDVQLVKRSVADEALSRFYGREATRRTKELGGNVAKETGKFFLKALFDMWK